MWPAAKQGERSGPGYSMAKSGRAWQGLPMAQRPDQGIEGREGSLRCCLGEQGGDQATLLGVSRRVNPERFNQNRRPILDGTALYPGLGSQTE